MTSITLAEAKPNEASPRHEPAWKREKIVRIPVKWVWHYGKLHSLRERLLLEKEGEMAAAAQPIEPHSMDMADSATDEFDHEMALCLLSREQNALIEVDAAIHRILTGTYGVCEESGMPIPERRLHVVPWTRYTREAQEAQEAREHEGLDRPPGIAPLASIQKGDTPVLEGAENPEADELLTREVDRHQKAGVLREYPEGTFDHILQELQSNAALSLDASAKNKHRPPSTRHQHVIPS